jgi:glycosyl hydrolase family 42 (putative beta-galactosidase)
MHQATDDRAGKAARAMRRAAGSGGQLRVACLCVAVVAALSSFAGVALAEEALVPGWLGRARIGGAELFSEMTAAEIAKSVAMLADQNVSVIEGDSDLSRLLTDKEFDAELGLMRRYSEAAHQRNMKVVWYYPALEVLTPNAKHGNKSMFQTHPDWVQRGIDGKPNVFYGGKRGKTRVHWVDPNTESAWMSVHSPYADVFIERIKKIAATGVDGIWLDVPIYNDIGASWSDMSPAAAAKFHADTGMEMPKTANWSDPVWRRWIAWRYQEISNFLLRIRDAAKSVTSDINIVVETVTLDYDASTMLGLDGSTMKTAPGIIQVWEVDAVSDKTGMREAKPDDWISLIGMSKFAKAASGTKPSWIFAYGKETDDGLLVLAEALAAGNHPYETKIPLMTTTVGSAYRKRVFSWIKREETRLFASESAAKVGVYFSPESRDYLDQASGTGLFATTKSKDALWWSREEVDSVYALTYLAEYRGVVKWLLHNHVPFDIVVRPDAAELARYDTLIAPALAAISDRDAALLDQYAANGGHLVVTGPKPGTLDEFGNPRSSAVLKSIGQREGSQLTALSALATRDRAAIHSVDLVGKAYLTGGSAAAGRALSELMGPYVHSPIETNADPTVHMELRRSGRELLLHLVNPQRLWNRKAPRNQDVTVRLDLPGDVTVTEVLLTSPEPGGKSAAKDAATELSAQSRKGSRRARAGKPAPAGRSGTAAKPDDARGSDQGSGKTAILPYSVEGNRVSFKVPLEAYALVVISTAPK